MCVSHCIENERHSGLGSSARLRTKGLHAIHIRYQHCDIQRGLALQLAVPGYSERILIHQAFILEDAIGRVTPVHLQFVNSWEAFDAILEARFRGIQGLRKIQSKHFTLQEKKTGREVSREWNWEGAFISGQHIDMSLIFQHEAQDHSVRSEECCPSCHKTLGGPQSSDLETIW